MHCVLGVLYMCNVCCVMMWLFMVCVRCVMYYGLCCVCVHCVYIVCCTYYLCGVCVHVCYIYQCIVGMYNMVFVVSVLIINKHDP